MIVPVSSHTPGLVVGEPILNSVAISLKAQLGIMGEVFYDFLLVEPSAIAFPKSEREIPTAISSAMDRLTDTV